MIATNLVEVLAVDLVPGHVEPAVVHNDGVVAGGLVAAHHQHVGHLTEQPFTETNGLILGNGCEILLFTGRVGL